MVKVFREGATNLNEQFIGKENTILVEGVSISVCKLIKRQFYNFLFIE